MKIILNVKCFSRRLEIVRLDQIVRYKYMYLLERYFKFKVIYKLYIKRWKVIYQVNGIRKMM